MIVLPPDPHVLERLEALGGPSLAQTYTDLRSRAIRLQGFGGALADPQGVSVKDLRRLWEVNLLDLAAEGNVIVYRSPGYDGPLRRVRKWRSRPQSAPRDSGMRSTVGN